MFKLFRPFFNSRCIRTVCERCVRRHATQVTSEESTHFGFETVTKQEKAHKVTDVFSKVAQKYDLMNDVMSVGIHRLWKDRLIDTLDPMPGTRLLDVAGGTGDIAFRFVQRVKMKEGANPTSSVVVCDINKQMLNVGKQRAEKLGFNTLEMMEWVEGDAQNLPFANNTFDAYTIAFGIRNVVDIQKALDESHRVLKPGGMFLCLEFSKVQNSLLERWVKANANATIDDTCIFRLYDWYSFEVIPVMGEVIASDWKSYQYLVESIRQFPDQQEFKSMIASSGYTLVDVDNLLNGVAAIHSAFKR
ncbi:hypothetical protein B4U79_02587 [Dinothrombium tinctorium]|uniref:2-methoxy-6-polyprenyl-1,4-benzoquinol methylase, mitochondrial n=1 Tax=Dinothrombium tinctorium TaxID=1965070 RepID=A0A443QUI4_9ACAR|nr:hypothetical protein B4U79_05852 [Dinothrombium tinctorium]RWS06703.1 hypothetical protein B4U79_02587 [Dinothrombium tinctorium]